MQNSYICRAAIGTESYKHFCPHFRQTPGTACQECDRCDLYVKEDEAAAIKRAAEKAEVEYFRKFKKPEGWRYRRRDHSTFRKCANWKPPLTPHPPPQKKKPIKSERDWLTFALGGEFVVAADLTWSEALEAGLDKILDLILA